MTATKLHAVEMLQQNRSILIIFMAVGPIYTYFRSPEDEGSYLITKASS